MPLTPAQKLASDPQLSVWTSASAGSGKTKALTDRVLRLTLGGAAPRSILCLTYTNAAAHEMQERVRAQLSRYILADDAALKAMLSEFEDAQILKRSPQEIRLLATEILESDEGLQIGTIHAFCRSLISRFPHEAGYDAGTRFIEERESEKMRQAAKNHVFSVGGDPQAIADLCRYLGTEDSLDKIFFLMLKEWSALKRANFTTEEGLKAAEMRLKRFLGVPPEATLNESIAQDIYPTDDVSLKDAFKSLMQCIEEGLGKKTDGNIAGAIANFIKAPTDDACANAYIDVLMKKDGDPRARLLTADAKKAYPFLEDFLRSEQRRLSEATALRDALVTLKRSVALWRVLGVILAEYDALKLRDNALDFDDMIRAANRLLKESDASLNALYATDMRVRHILLDEAQDTAPLQWDIVSALTDEQFSGRERQGRSLFVVGDEKQSIFRFQGADPENFMRMRGYFSSRAKEASVPFKAADMDMSFRTVPEVLRLVDKTFEDEETLEGVANAPVKHIAARGKDSGRVVLHPLCEAEKTADAQEWRVPDGYASHAGADALQADAIADFIANALANGMATASRPNGLKPGDFLVMVRSRAPMADLIRSSCMRRGVPAAPPDKFGATDHLIAKDMLAMAEISCYPHNDYALAALLRSPFFGIDDALLERLCVTRDGSLFDMMANIPECAEYVSKIRRYNVAARSQAPYEFFERLMADGAARRIYRERWGEEADVVIGRLLTEADAFSREPVTGVRHFLSYLKRTKITLSGDAKATDAVRILTVHKSKGLQAPVAIIAHAAKAQRPRSLIYWTDGESPLPVWPGATKNQGVTDLKIKEQLLTDQESKRLLYVAMTRAADELHVFGAVPASGKLTEDSWYARIQKAAEDLGAVTAENGELIYGRAHVSGVAYARPAHAEKTPPSFLRPIKKTPSENAVAAPSAAITEHYKTAGAAALRGERLHRLIERLSAMLSYVPEADEMRAVASVCSGADKDAAPLLERLLHNAEIATLLRGNIRFEVPLIGEIDGKRVSGRADIIAERADGVAVVDIKTGERPDANSAAFAAYRKQLHVYKTLAQRHYAGQKVTAHILWADAARLEEVMLYSQSHLK